MSMQYTFFDQKDIRCMCISSLIITFPFHKMTIVLYSCNWRHHQDVLFKLIHPNNKVVLCVIVSMSIKKKFFCILVCTKHNFIPASSSSSEEESSESISEAVISRSDCWMAGSDRDLEWLMAGKLVLMGLFPPPSTSSTSSPLTQLCLRFTWTCLRPTTRLSLSLFCKIKIYEVLYKI